MPSIFGFLALLLTTYRGACSIPQGDQIILTGGGETRKTVSRYDKDGWMRDMPSLNQGRYGHGCTTYMIGREEVRLTLLIMSHMNINVSILRF